MTSSPIYDDSKPITCTAGAEERTTRIAQLERMRQDVDEIERTPYGLILNFADRDDIAARLQQFTVDEKRCCEFWGFDIGRDGIRIRMRWDGPPMVDELFDQLAELLTGDQPINSVEGLL